MKAVLAETTHDETAMRSWSCVVDLGGGRLVCGPVVSREDLDAALSGIDDGDAGAEEATESAPNSDDNPAD